jgi:hypothetical protein
MGKKVKQTEPRRVTEIPEGYTQEIRDGRKVWVLKTENKKPKTSVKVGGIRPPKNTPVLPKEKKTIPEDDFSEDVIYMEESTPPVTQKVQSLRTDAKEVFTGGLPKGIHQYQVPDLNTGGNYAKQKQVFTDEERNPVSYDFKTNQYIKTGEPNFRSTMPVQNDTPTIQTPLKEGELPTKFDVVPERLRTQQYNTPKIVAPTVDTTKYKGFNEVGKDVPVVPNAEFQKEQEKNLAIPKLNKGGLVGKIMGKYATGGNVNYNEFGNNIGVIGQNDPYASQQAENVNAEKKAKNEQMARDSANVAGKALGAYGGTYYNSQTPTSNEDATRNAGMATVSNMGAIGGAIGGISAFGDKIGKGVKKDAQKMDEKGNLIDEDKSRRNAIGGGLFSPTKALAYRKESGNWGDITGKKYNKFLEDKAKKQLAEVEKANAQGNINQALAARDAGQFSYTKTDLYDTTGATFDTDTQQMTLANGQQFDPNRRYAKGGLVGKIKQMYAKGGVIKGKGTGKSDSIDAKIEGDSFVVPAQNAPIAEELRKKLLGKPPKAKADLKQKDGVPVKLSNGEHLFTPEEKRELLNRGVNVDLLAPNSEVKAVQNKNMVQFPKVVGYATGGEVFEEDAVDPKKELARLKDEQKASVNKRISDYEKRRIAEKNADIDEYLKDQELQKVTDVNKASKALELARKEYDNLKNAKIGGVLGYTEENYIKEQIKRLEKIEAAESKLKESVKIYKPSVNGKTNATVNKSDVNVSEKQAGSKDVKGKTYAEWIKKPNHFKGTDKEWKDAADKAIREGKVKVIDAPPSTSPVVKAPAVKRTGSVKATAGKFEAPKAEYNPADDVTVPNGDLSPNQISANKTAEDKAKSDAEALNKSAMAYDETKPKTAPRGSRFRGLAGKIDPTMFAGIGQTALGLNMLKNEVRPIDQTKLDPTFDANVNRAQQDAKFGFTPEQNFALEQARQNAVNDSRFSARNFAGGNAGTAFNQERQAINQGWMAKLGLASENQQLRMEKQRYADQQAANRGNVNMQLSRNAFSNAMDTFQQKQQAGSELIGAGINNTIGAIRYQQELDAMEKADKERNRYLGTV